MTVALRQICLVAAELRPAIDSLTGVLGINTCFVDDAVSKFGLENTLMTVGNSFLEVVAPIRDGTAAGRYLDRRGGDGGYMVICQAGSRETQDRIRALAHEEKVRVAFDADHESWNICQFHPADMIASFLEVDWDTNCDFNGRWMPAGGHGWEDSVSRSAALAFAGVELQADDVDALANRWSRVLGIGLVESATGPALPLHNAVVRFVPATDGRGPGLGGIDLRVVDIDRMLAAATDHHCPVKDHCMTICGTRFYLSED